ncbi:DUF1800 domain-containing protein [Flavobacterium jejuense]|uniref:DUF1800 domain-containing protein n=1 Tax=Flavobacterium jejuense TaxID=1544455 RepID=A0ABX0IQY7_9FLAO|nr:DUF1800 domain-containing protein [Flavobacterium jejuense]NHN26240.1 DUF1800 domain-containing protein [Flavobacterium jejuense]
MNANTLWSLRLGFSNKQSNVIEKLGITGFLEQSFQSKVTTTTPAFLKDSPKTLAELKAIRQEIKKADSLQQKKLIKKQVNEANELRKWWLEKMQNEELPLREKMTCFWHNHFVSTIQKVKVNYWVYQHNMILRENAFGNFRELTKKIIQSNAMVRYLDNVDNRKGKLNENLSRELLELFTLGIGHYTEEDVKNGAKALAGLNLGNEKATYRKSIEDNDTITYLGETGQFKVEGIIDIIFKQKNTTYFLTEKLLKWFIYDNPTNELITYYGNYFKSVDYEIQPLLTKIFTEEFEKNTAGSKIKDPLVYALQLIDELQIKETNSMVVIQFLKQQGMELFNQPNVKGWLGGNNWMTSQIYLQRNNATDFFVNGQNLIARRMKEMDEEDMKQRKVQKGKIDFDSNGTNKTIIKELTDRLLFTLNETTQKDMESILKYDFNPKSESAAAAVLRLFTYITKLPEFQII